MLVVNLSTFLAIISYFLSYVIFGINNDVQVYIRPPCITWLLGVAGRTRGVVITGEIHDTARLSRHFMKSLLLLHSKALVEVAWPMVFDFAISFKQLFILCFHLSFILLI